MKELSERGYRRVFKDARFALPYCAVCHCHVQHCEGAPDEEKNIYIMKAYCHGEIDVVTIPLDYFDDPSVTAKSVHFDTAFAGRAVELRERKDAIQSR